MEEIGEPSGMPPIETNINLPEGGSQAQGTVPEQNIDIEEIKEIEQEAMDQARESLEKVFAKSSVPPPVEEKYKEERVGRATQEKTNNKESEKPEQGEAEDVKEIDFESGDYYQILGVTRESSREEIDKAYRSLAREYHPDRNPGSEEAVEKFKKVSEAYETLSNEDKRATYDRGSLKGAQARQAESSRAKRSEFEDVNFTPWESGNLGDLWGRGSKEKSQAKEESISELSDRWVAFADLVGVDPIAIPDDERLLKKEEILLTQLEKLYQTWQEFAQAKGLSMPDSEYWQDMVDAPLNVIKGAIDHLSRQKGV